ncbi:sigma-54 dependent transcriptional regulator [Gemmata sp. JC717]|uniref:sigma-54 interaction domain-containing protein n=1 Tax=Gemmata algarum TaxID=2975278 RepID=UPI0021BB6DFE|nr:sigma-54 dependent transcriptional regulator [Gemmata algarum]MDY3553669.1 sigma-54 dependent transcriptional regulator [Gemmata algarum]
MTPLIGALPGVRKAIQQVAGTDATVLILGETGTGKELVARSLHAQSPRAREAFVPVNCGALPQSLVVAELFGFEAGAFTGAARRHAGRFEQANGGTLFLDEVGELTADAQVALLRALQERVVQLLGGCKPVPVDVRLIAATNCDLTAGVRERTFRADLFYRLNVFPIQLPALRDRRDDVPALAAHFLQHFAARHNKPANTISAPTLRKLAAYDWPGNARELQNVIERAVIVSEGDELVVDPAWLGAPPVETARTWAEQEKARIVAALRAAGGRVYGPGGAAHRLGLKPTTLYGKMRKHGITRDADWQ